MKKALLSLTFISVLTGCASAPQTFYEKKYALPVEARAWAKEAQLKDLCKATKNWVHDHIREAALNEIKARNIDTRQCYYTGMELTP